MSDSKVIVSDELVKEYSRIKQVSLEQARANLEANIKKENEGVDLSQQYKTLIQAFRTMSPQLNGVVMRETDMANQVKSLESKVKGLGFELESVNQKLEFQQGIFEEAIRLLSEKAQPLYVRVWNRIKCLLKI
jgi:phosphoglycerate-specific signal transduction histidine kinase